MLFAFPQQPGEDMSYIHNLIYDIRDKLDELEIQLFEDQPVEDDLFDGKVVVVDMWCDGGTSGGNPGDGYCSYTFGDVGETARLGSQITNNVAEYQAVLKGVEAVKKQYDTKLTHLIIHTDSQLVIGQVSKGWKINKEHLRPLIARVKAETEAFRTFSFKKEPREIIVARLGH